MSAERLKIQRESRARETSETTNHDETELTKLVERAVGGDFTAFGELYSIFLDRIYRYVFYQVRDKMTAEDLTEETFLKAWKGVKSYKGNGQSFSSWLFRIAHNCVIDYFRAKREDVVLEKQIIANDSDPEQELEVKLMQQELLQAISHLAPQQKQVIILKFMEELDNSEIAKIMQKRQGTIRVTQMRALAALRRILSEEREKCELSYQRS